MTRGEPIIFNGVDPDGEAPPEQVLYQPEGGDSINLVSRGDRTPEWRLRVWEDGTTMTRENEYDDFETAFAQFVAAIRRVVMAA